jgi:hypothetical protein
VTVPGSSGYLVAKMLSEELKVTIFAQKSKLKGNKDKIYINEELTKQDAKIFKKARDDVKHKRLSAAWTRGGIVFAKKTPNGTPFKILDLQK